MPSSDILERSSIQVAEYSEGQLVRTFEQAVEACGNLLIKAGHCSNGRPRGRTFAIEPAERAIVTGADYDDDGRAWSYVLNQYDIDKYESSGAFSENKAQGYGQQGNYLGTFSGGKKNGLMWWNGVEKCHYKEDKRQGDCTTRGLVYYQDRFLHRSFFYNTPRIEMTMMGRYVDGLRHGLFTYTNNYLGYTGTLSYDNGVETSRFVLKDAAGTIVEDTQRRGGRRVDPGKCSYAGVLEDCEFESDLRIDAFHVARVEGLIARDKADKIEQKRLAALAVQQEQQRREKAKMVPTGPGKPQPIRQYVMHRIAKIPAGPKPIGAGLCRRQTADTPAGKIAMRPLLRNPRVREIAVPKRLKWKSPVR